jgi:hypothetical protein
LDKKSEKLGKMGIDGALLEETEKFFEVEAII